MYIYIFGNGNTSFSDFRKYYETPLLQVVNNPGVHFLVGEFRGVDTLALEFLKTLTPHVTLYHVGERPRYLPDRFKTHVAEWKVIGNFKTDQERDCAAIDRCTHYLAIDFNSDEKRKSGTLKNIELCNELGKIYLGDSKLR
ncbi:hypothetical protein ACFQ21_17370 [Ohtaekwangia kribbensis]|jgi:hypothetical protein|uniref:Uncharacterized protein n=1 Tax=Ohtaekwangia kribbensis TaxID=688913 RepID=A0ABW3K7H0_9BACT